jgi:anthranilate/para-aminobenzoate synthase component I
MNPICGTLAKSTLSNRQDLINFLNDSKEINELFQVVDETLKTNVGHLRCGGDSGAIP